LVNASRVWRDALNISTKLHVKDVKGQDISYKMESARRFHVVFLA
jgi:hypothetical protein